MSCPECDGERVRLRLPEPAREHAPGGREDAAVVLCTRCLRCWPSAEDRPDENRPEADPREVSDALPADREAAAAVLLAASLLDSVVGNRPALTALFEFAEREGADPRLAVERLGEDGSIDPATDLRRRLRQFEAL